MRAQATEGDRSSAAAARFERGPRVEFDLATPLDGHVQAQVERTPAAIALSDEAELLTYGDMWARVLALAARLRADGIGRGDVVGVCARRSVDLPVALLAVLRCGAAYCPLEPDQPAPRLRHAIEQARPAAVLAPAALGALVEAATAGTGCGRAIAIDGAGRGGAGAAAERREPAPEDPAYVMFTSGSTGRPKGVAVPHRGVVNRLLWMQEQFGLGADDTVLQKTPFGFDVSVWELFWPLLAGARLHLAEPDGHLDPGYLAACIRAERVTTVHFVPSMLALFLDEPGAARCASLRRVICSGEALSAPLMEKALAALEPATLWNLYGPTEASIDVTCWQCELRRGDSVVPIGAPIANADCFVVGDDGERLPVGATGELCLGGVQVALGYVGQPELTAECFVELPWAEGAVYRTGDLARWRPDGLLEYLGRRDRQVKLHGVRIELGEIEAVLEALPGVVDAAVVLVSGEEAGERLAAYVVPSEEGLEAAGLRRELSARLPRSMVPSAIRLVPALPKTSSGKLDRNALPKLELFI